jgi:hypothetical protein
LKASPDPSWGTITLAQAKRDFAPGMSPDPSWGTITIAAAGAEIMAHYLLTPHGERSRGRCCSGAVPRLPPAPSWGTITRWLDIPVAQIGDLLTQPRPIGQIGHPARACAREPGRRAELQRAKFLELIASGRSITAAARAAKVSRDSLYRWRNENAEFAAAWDEAREAGLDALEDKARDLAEEGDTKMIIFLLKAGRLEKYRENVDVRGKLHLTHEERLAQLEELE